MRSVSGLDLDEDFEKIGIKFPELTPKSPNPIYMFKSYYLILTAGR
jgi:hypothetical protein